jgi:hypothetical protein
MPLQLGSYLSHLEPAIRNQLTHNYRRRGPRMPSATAIGKRLDSQSAGESGNLSLRRSWSCLTLLALLLGRDGVHSTNKKFTIVRLDCEIRSMLRRRCGLVMGKEYVQEHILAGGIVAPVEGASPTHSSPLSAISLSVVASYPTHLWRKSLLRACAARAADGCALSWLHPHCN